MLYCLRDNVEEFNPMRVEFFYNFYVPENSLIIDCDPNLTRLGEIKIPDDVKNIVFDSSNPWDVEHILNQNNTKYITHYLTGDYRYFKNPIPYAKVQFFPFWAMWMSNPYAPLMPMGDHAFSDTPKKYLVSCLNGTQWAHRKLTYLTLYKKTYFKEMVFSFIQRLNYQSLSEEIKLTAEEIEEFQLLPQVVNFNNASFKDKVNLDLSIMHPAYQESYINLVTETTISAVTPMLSEKTFKPIVAGQLFVLIASPGAVQFLRDLGIDTFDDIIDHTYDKVQDSRTRIQMAIDQIDKLVGIDLEKLYTTIKPRLLKNSEYFLSEEFRSQFPLNFN